MSFGFMKSGDKKEIKKTVELIENAIKNEGMVELIVVNSMDSGPPIKKEATSHGILPLRLVYLDGELEVIGEELKRGILRPFLVENICEIQERHLPKNYKKNLTGQDVIDYIESGRLVIENEERLVLKIPSGQKIDLAPPYLYMGNPFAAINSDGDMIWAASLEISIPLFEWLSMNPKIEILDPPSVAIQLQLFLQNKRRA